MFAVRRCGDRPLGVQAVGQRQVDRIDFSVGQQRFVAAVMAADALRRSERSRRLFVAAGHGNDAHRRAGGDVAAELAGDVGAAEDADGKR